MNGSIDLGSTCFFKVFSPKVKIYTQSFVSLHHMLTKFLGESPSFKIFHN